MFHDTRYLHLGDWEIEHEKFVMEYDADKLPPSPHEIPKIWETTDLSDFWSAGDLDVSQSYDSVAFTFLNYTSSLGIKRRGICRKAC